LEHDVCSRQRWQQETLVSCSKQLWQSAQFTSTCMPQSSTLQVDKSGGTQFGALHMPLGAYGTFAIYL